jgi:lysophospholipid hydrolase
MYMVMNGRLQATNSENNGVETMKREYGKGEGVGAIELMTRRPRQDTVKAVRTTEMIRIQAASFRTLAATSPKIALQISQHIAKGAASLIECSEATSDSNNLPVSKRSIRTIALIPLGTDGIIESFCADLAQSIVEIGLEHAGNISILDFPTIVRFLGPDLFDRGGSVKLAGYLGHLEDRMRVVFYIPDFDPHSKWTQICISQASLEDSRIRMITNSPWSRLTIYCLLGPQMMIRKSVLSSTGS